jgi:hypothetical protein
LVGVGVLLTIAAVAMMRTRSRRPTPVTD